MTGRALVPDLVLAVAGGAVGGRFTHARLAVPLTCHGQLVALPIGRYDWLHLETRCAVELEVTVWLHYVGGIDPEPLWIPSGDPAWSRVPVTRRDKLLAIRLPRHESATVLSVSLAGSAVAR